MASLNLNYLLKGLFPNTEYGGEVGGRVSFNRDSLSGVSFKGATSLGLNFEMPTWLASGRRMGHLS